MNLDILKVYKLGERNPNKNPKNTLHKHDITRKAHPTDQASPALDSCPFRNFEDSEWTCITSSQHMNFKARREESIRFESPRDTSLILLAIELFHFSPGLITAE